MKKYLIISNISILKNFQITYIKISYIVDNLYILGKKCKAMYNKIVKAIRLKL